MNKKIVIAITLSLFAVALSSGLSQSAYATGRTISDKASCEAIGGTWDAPLGYPSHSKHCTVSSSTTNSGNALTINPTITNNDNVAGDYIIDSDGITSPGIGSPDTIDVKSGDPLLPFPSFGNPPTGLDWFDQDGNGVWTQGVDGLHSEDPASCPTAIRDGLHEVGKDCVVVEGSIPLSDGEQVSCDLEVGANFGTTVTVCPDPQIKFHDANGDGVYEMGEDIVYDSNNNGIFDCETTCNTSPVAVAGSDQAYNGGGTVDLDGSKSYDPDPGDFIDSYLWIQTGGPPVVLDNSDIAHGISHFHAPIVPDKKDVTFTFDLHVADTHGAEGTARVNITICSVYAEATFDTNGPYCDHRRIEIKATNIKVDPDKLTSYRHLFIVTTTKDGTEILHRGGPDSFFNNIVVISQLYQEGGTDWDPTAESNTIFGVGADNPVRPASGVTPILACFFSQMNQINSWEITYHTLGSNSNSVARTLLHNCGAPETLPIGIKASNVPGWNIILNQHMH